MVDHAYSVNDLERFNKIATDYLDSEGAFCLVGNDYRMGAIRVVVRKERAGLVRDGLYKRIPADAMDYSASVCQFTS